MLKHGYDTFIYIATGIDREWCWCLQNELRMGSPTTKGKANMEQELKPLKTSEAEIYMHPHTLRFVPYKLSEDGERLYDIETLDYWLSFSSQER